LFEQRVCQLASRYDPQLFSALLILDQFWDNCRGKFNPRDREDIHHLCNYIALKLKDIRPEEASAARVFAGLLKTEHL